MKTGILQWKRRLAWTGVCLFLVTLALGAFLFDRLHFSYQHFPASLARWQASRSPTSRTDETRPRIIGHRGAAIPATSGGHLIGNTKRAIQQAIDADVDWIEIDIRKSADGALVVFHDETIDLKTDGEGTVSELDLEQLQAVRVCVAPAERILSLDEVFASFHADDRKWIFDIKDKAVREPLLRWLEERVAAGEITKDQVMLFGVPEILRDYEDCGYSKGCTAVWSRIGNRLRVLFTPSEILDRCEAVDSEILVLPVIFANRRLVDAANSRGLQVWVYGTDDRRDLENLAARGVNGFIVDEPQGAREVFGNGDVEQ